MSIATYASGSQTATLTTEHELSAPSEAGEYALQLDLNNMAANDVLEVRAYLMVASGGTARPIWFHMFAGAQPSHALNAVSQWVANTLTEANAIRFTIKQTFGTGRAYPYKILRRGGDEYAAKVWMSDDDSGAADRFVARWYKNLAPVTANNTTTIQVIKVADGTDLVAAASMTHVANGLMRYTESSNRIVDGATYEVKVSATIDGATRTWFQPISRDS